LEGSQTGYSLSSAGDFNGDGYQDILLGAPGVDGDKGFAYVVFGGNILSDLDLSMPEFGRVFKLSAPGLDDSGGYALSRAGDIDGDGFDDILVSSKTDLPNRIDAGSVTLIKGFDTSDGQKDALVLSSGNDTYSASLSTDHIVAGQGDDDISGLASGDSLHAGAGDDLIGIDEPNILSINGGSGFDTLRLESNITQIDNLTLDRVSHIEAIDLGAHDEFARTVRLNFNDILRFNEGRDLSSDASALRILGDTTVDGEFTDKVELVSGSSSSIGPGSGQFSDTLRDVNLDGHNFDVWKYNDSPMSIFLVEQGLSLIANFPVA
jgi:hypothetical protein